MENEVVISKMESEIVDSVQRAVCDYFNINEDGLMTNKNFRYVYIRRLCLFLIKENTTLSLNDLSAMFHVERSNIFKGIDVIKFQKGIYTSVAYDVKNIYRIANNFEKKFEWQLPLQ